MSFKTSTMPEESPMSGRNTFAFWTIVWLIFVLTIGNLVLTLTIIGVLHLGKGMEFLELVPEMESIKFFGSTDLDRIYKKDGIIEGFSDVPMTITGENANVQISLMKTNGYAHNKMLMSKNGTQFSGVNQFEIKDMATNELIFTTHKPHYNMPSGAENLVAQAVSSSGIRAPIDESLVLNNTRGKLNLRGSEGIHMDGKEIVLTADQNLQLKTHNGSIVLTSSNGVFIDINNIPIVEEHGIKIENKQFKICVCMPQGKLFRVSVANVNHNYVKGICSYYHSKYDPCM